MNERKSPRVANSSALVNQLFLVFFLLQALFHILTVYIPAIRLSIPVSLFAILYLSTPASSGTFIASSTFPDVLFLPFRNYENVVDKSECIVCFVKNVVHDLLNFGWHNCQSVKSSVEDVRSS